MLLAWHVLALWARSLSWMVLCLLISLGDEGERCIRSTSSRGIVSTKQRKSGVEQLFFC